jgi:hypothetical protein
MLERFIGACEADERVVGALLVGSRAAGTADEHSDLDLHIVTRDDAHASFLEDRQAFARHLGEPLLVEGFDLPDVLFVIYADGTELELTVTPVGELRVVGPHEVLLDRTGSVAQTVASRQQSTSSHDVRPADLQRRLDAFWHDVSHFATALARGQLVWAYGQLDDLRRLCLDLACVLAEPPVEAEGYWKADASVDPQVLQELTATMRGPAREELFAAGQGVLALYRRLAAQAVERHGAVYPERLDRLISARLAAAHAGPA